MMLPHLRRNFLDPTLKCIMNLFSDIEELLVSSYDFPSGIDAEPLEYGDHLLQYLCDPASGPRRINVKELSLVQLLPEPPEQKQIACGNNTGIFVHQSVNSSMSF